MTWLVYAIAPDHRQSEPFYIGITTDIHRRASQHNCWDSAAYDKSKALEAIGIHCTMYELARYETKPEALAYETAMIALHDGLVNRTQAACTRAFAQDYAKVSAAESNEISRKSGRPRLYASAAEKQRAYRERKLAHG